jgi:hypothetical protein
MLLFGKFSLHQKLECCKQGRNRPYYDSSEIQCPVLFFSKSMVKQVTSVLKGNTGLKKYHDNVARSHFPQYVAVMNQSIDWALRQGCWEKPIVMPYAWQQSVARSHTKHDHAWWHMSHLDCNTSHIVSSLARIDLEKNNLTDIFLLKSRITHFWHCTGTVTTIT